MWQDGPTAAEASPAATNRDPTYVLRLYVTGMTSHSIQAVTNLKAICEAYLAGHYDLEVIDLYQQPARAKDQQILFAPTLIKELPHPLRRLVGNLAQTDRVLVGLDLHPRREERT
jgi:circadian clock protein KaiB